ncbi:hypothetical protein GFC01_05860 [Desulfofundulus thermobenzoicus]|uniref:Uncharacterized protein n=1 Tax=Desulfofundulus thermobenzoicus TaxID=29376 RepID=A0A6N7IP77_9FIRM|nr:hypothetical protein [Desulfofundulus thermobenzoicus]MQL51794.1 hypothetical protein [Desulfofundulus thermobenzoicus]
MTSNLQFGDWLSDDETQEFDPYGLVPSAEEAALEALEPENEPDRLDALMVRAAGGDAARDGGELGFLLAEALDREPCDGRREKVTLKVRVPMSAPASFPEDDPYCRPFTLDEARATLASGGDTKKAKVLMTYLPDPGLFDEDYRPLGRSQAIVAEIKGRIVHLFLQHRPGDGKRRAGWRIISIMVEHEAAVAQRVPFDFGKYGIRVGAKVNKPVTGVVEAVYPNFAYIRTRWDERVIVYPGDLAAAPEKSTKGVAKL